MDPRGDAYPPGFGIAIDPATRRPSPAVLVGGSPMRVVRLTDAGARVIDAWASGDCVGPSRRARHLASRLVDAGIANPRPPAGAGPRPQDLTVVVPVRDRAGGLAKTLAALEGLDVVVVDDASVEPVHIDGCKVLRRETPGGPAAARNAGWRACERPVVVFLDADCVPRPGWLERLLPHLEDDQVAAVAPRVLSAPADGLIARYERHRSPLDLGALGGRVRPATRIPYVPTACLAVRRSVLEELGGFDERLRYGEDVDLVWRFDRAGWMVRYEPTATVLHPPRAGMAGFIKQRFDYGRSAGALAARHGSAVAPLSISPWSATAWFLANAGRPARTTLLFAGLSGALAARSAPTDRFTRRAVARAAARGSLLSGLWVAAAVRRAWTVPLIVALAIPIPALRKRAATWLAASFLCPLGEWAAIAWNARQPEISPGAWLRLRFVDDLSYQAGLLTGAVEHRSLRALLPRWTGPTPRWPTLRSWRPPRARGGPTRGSRASAAGGGRSGGTR
jgi:mycofactocin system glycosyltransferase